MITRFSQLFRRDAVDPATERALERLVTPALEAIAKEDAQQMARDRKAAIAALPGATEAAAASTRDFAARKAAAHQECVDLYLRLRAAERAAIDLQFASYAASNRHHAILDALTATIIRTNPALADIEQCERIIANEIETARRLASPNPEHSRQIAGLCKASLELQDLKADYTANVPKRLAEIYAEVSLAAPTGKVAA